MAKKALERSKKVYGFQLSDHMKKGFKVLHALLSISLLFVVLFSLNHFSAHELKFDQERILEFFNIILSIMPSIIFFEYINSKWFSNRIVLVCWITKILASLFIVYLSLRISTEDGIKLPTFKLLMMLIVSATPAVLSIFFILFKADLKKIYLYLALYSLFMSLMAVGVNVISGFYKSNDVNNDLTTLAKIILCSTVFLLLLSIGSSVFINNLIKRKNIGILLENNVVFAFTNISFAMSPWLFFGVAWVSIYGIKINIQTIISFAISGLLLISSIFVVALERLFKKYINLIAFEILFILFVMMGAAINTLYKSEDVKPLKNISSFLVLAIGTIISLFTLCASERTFKNRYNEWDFSINYLGMILFISLSSLPSLKLDISFMKSFISVDLALILLTESLLSFALVNKIIILFKQ